MAAANNYVKLYVKPDNDIAIRAAEDKYLPGEGIYEV